MGSQRRHNRRGYFSNISNPNLIRYIKEHHKGKTIFQLNLDDSRAYFTVRTRKLIPLLIKKNILQQKKRRGHFFKASNDEILEYVRAQHFGKNYAQLQKDDGRLYHAVRTRKLGEKLERERVIFRTQKRSGTWKDLEYVLQQA